MNWATKCIRWRDQDVWFWITILIIWPISLSALFHSLSVIYTFMALFFCLCFHLQYTTIIDKSGNATRKSLVRVGGSLTFSLREKDAVKRFWYERKVCFVEGNIEDLLSLYSPSGERELSLFIYLGRKM